MLPLVSHNWGRIILYDVCGWNHLNIPNNHRRWCYKLLCWKVTLNKINPYPASHQFPPTRKNLFPSLFFLYFKSFSPLYPLVCFSLSPLSPLSPSFSLTLSRPPPPFSHPYFRSIYHTTAIRGHAQNVYLHCCSDSRHYSSIYWSQSLLEYPFKSVRFSREPFQSITL